MHRAETAAESSEFQNVLEEASDLKVLSAATVFFTETQNAMFKCCEDFFFPKRYLQS